MYLNHVRGCLFLLGMVPPIHVDRFEFLIYEIGSKSTNTHIVAVSKNIQEKTGKTKALLDLDD